MFLALVTVVVLVIVGLLSGGIVLILKGKRALGVSLVVTGLVPVIAVGTYVCMALGIVSSVSPEPRETFASCFLTPLPSEVRITHYTSDASWKDPSFWWECAPIDERLLSDLRAKNQLVPKAPDTSDTPPTLFFPRWWDHRRIQALPAFYNDTGSGGIRTVWIDQANQRLYISFNGY